MRVFVVTLAALLLSLPQLVEATTLDRIQKTGEFRIGYREDAPPFAFKDSIGEVGGYSVDLCRAIAADLKRDLGLEKIDVKYVAVDSKVRFQAIQEGEIDILCGPTTQTLSRRAIVDFSLPTFIDGASVLFRADGPNNFEDLAGKKVGVRAATTTEEALRNTLDKLKIGAEVVSVAKHDEGLGMLQSGDIAAYFADRGILTFMLIGSSDPSALRLSNRFYTQEPYALALKRGDSDFRLAVDRTLTHLYKSGEIIRIFRASFGTKTEATDMLKALYVINRLPE